MCKAQGKLAQFRESDESVWAARTDTAHWLVEAGVYFLTVLGGRPRSGCQQGCCLLSTPWLADLHLLPSSHGLFSVRIPGVSASS